MDERPADVEREIRLTRERMADTVAEIEDRISEKTAAVKRKLDVLQLAAEHPWPALGVAFAAGLLLSATGADRRALRGARDAATRAADGAVDAARNAGPLLGDLVDRVKSTVADRSSSTAAPNESGAAGLVDRAKSALGVDEMGRELERGARLE